MKQINSIHNPFLKNLLKLQEKSRERKKQGVFIIEGKREIDLAIKGNYQIKQVLFCSDIFPLSEVALLNLVDCEHIEIAKEVYEKLAYRNSTEGIIAIAITKPFSLSTLEFKTTTPLILVAEATEKPGNIGAMLRTADAANIDAFLIANPKTDLYNQNVIRSSVGCLFTNQIGVGTSEEIIAFLHQKGIGIFAATLQNSNSYIAEDFTKASAIVVGTEATGLSDAWRKEEIQNINIPMQGEIDSMNVSVAAAILLFEAKRQRNFNLTN